METTWYELWSDFRPTDLNESWVATAPSSQPFTTGIRTASKGVRQQTICSKCDDAVAPIRQDPEYDLSGGIVGSVLSCEDDAIIIQESLFSKLAEAGVRLMTPMPVKTYSTIRDVKSNYVMLIGSIGGPFLPRRNKYQNGKENSVNNSLCPLCRPSHISPDVSSETRSDDPCPELWDGFDFCSPWYASEFMMTVLQNLNASPIAGRPIPVSLDLLSEEAIYRMSHGPSISK